LVRVEDLDKPREVAGATDGILKALEAFGFEWDGEILRQSERVETYRAALQELQSRGLIFACTCSRLQLENEQRYPGTCRRHPARLGLASAARLKVDGGRITFLDEVQGLFTQDLGAEVGDVILQRRDQIFAYLMAVVVDDDAQGVTNVVRGADLLDNTPRQIYVQRQFHFAQPSYAHVPVLMDDDGIKLSKSRRSLRLRDTQALAELLSVFSLLGLDAPPLDEFSATADAWRWAIAHWNVNTVPKCLKLSLKG
jgi:glutamyl-Q tRNA(Asp) synthetase